jgi:hypothetical protein
MLTNHSAGCGITTAAPVSTGVMPKEGDSSLPRLKQSEVLRYEKGRKSQATVRRHYIQWRLQQDPPLPLRCDNPKCVYFTGELIWNGMPLKLILDHINGVNGDNRTKNLQFLCPNCNSQLSTHGGSNIGKVIQSSGGFAQVAKDGKKHHTLPAEPGDYIISGSDADLKKVSA